MGKSGLVHSSSGRSGPSRPVSSRLSSCLLALSLLCFCGREEPVAADIPLKVRDGAGLARQGEMVQNGIPIARADSLVDEKTLALVDAKGQAVPAQFEVLSRHGGGLKGKKPIQWLHVAFPAEVGSRDSAGFRIVTGINRAPAKAVTVTQDAASVTVNTGAARFRLSKVAFNVLEEAVLLPNTSGGKEIRLAGSGVAAAGVPALSGSAQVLPVGAAGASLLPMLALPPEEVKVERQGPLWAVVKLSGHFSNAPFGPTRWRYVARYHFHAGKPHFDLDFYFAFPGNKAGASSVRGSLEGVTRDHCVKVREVKLSFPVSLAGGAALPAGASLSGYGSAEEGPGMSASLSAAQSVSLRQALRPAMTAPSAYTLDVGGQKKQGRFASWPLVALSGAEGGVGVSLQKMKFYEPQALSLSSRECQILLVADSQWVGPYMGAYAKATVSLLPPKAPLDSLRDQLLARQEKPLFAWPGRQYVAKGMVMDEIWDGKPHPLAQNYFNRLSRISQNTLKAYSDLGLHGFMTYGLTPRYWYDGMMGNEFGDTKTWDGYFFGGTFTDYHNCFANTVTQFAQSEEGWLLSDLAFPAARRNLNSLIVQYEPGTTEFYAGWAPTGYGAYRNNFNSSHSYFLNVYYYYYLTGDRQVLDILGPGADILRHAYARKKDEALIPAVDPPLDPEKESMGRVASQHGALWWFIGHASQDSTYLDDYRNMLDRFACLNLALLKKDGKEYAYFTEKTLAPTADSLRTSQTWMFAQYDLQNIWNLYKEYGDVKLGRDTVRVSRLFKAAFETYMDQVAKTYNPSGSVEGEWANQLDVRWSGPRIGGQLRSAAGAKVGEHTLYTTGKSLLTASLFRAAYMHKSQAMYDQAAKLLVKAVDWSRPETQAWGKETAMHWIQVHGAVGQLASGLYGAVAVPIRKGPGGGGMGGKAARLGAPKVKVAGDAFRRQVEIAYGLDARQKVYMGVYSTSGSLLRVLSDRNSQDTGNHVETWDGRDAGGRFLSPGTYFLKIRIGDRSFDQSVVF